MKTLIAIALFGWKSIGMLFTFGGVTTVMVIVFAGGIYIGMVVKQGSTKIDWKIVNDPEATRLRDANRQQREALAETQLELLTLARQLQDLSDKIGAPTRKPVGSPFSSGRDDMALSPGQLKLR